MVNAQFYWHVFELTGSINAYLMYKNLLIN
ncbi:YqzL family protein [Clostridium sp. D2Q-11]|uniref:YqzL family protein n=1 Tax=Anaeromonas frigoriresistens TaxID=2683708 RepID=A0A942USX6_9FIRM|nr:YqzL family protein [Anaeromonas frigoriresistens]MBS4537988.1 YqzL family protein [Anaeromonas frigoriresistens]